MGKLQRHQNIVQYFGAKDCAIMTKKDDTQVKVAYLIFEKLPNGDLYDYVSECGHFSES